MSNSLKQIADLSVLLKDLEPYVKNPNFLTQGIRFSNFNMLIREAWANWLICVALENDRGDKFTFLEQPDGDGIILNKTSRLWTLTEHVCAMNFPAGKQLPKGEDRVIWAIKHKIKRGVKYAKDKWLIVFMDGAGKFYRDKIRETIKGKHFFDTVFCIALLTADSSGYSYSVTEFNDSYGNKSITYKIDINADFTAWNVTQIKS